MDTFLRDLRYAVRSLIRRPGFTAAVTFTMALGIGVNTAIFSVVNGVLLRPLPYPAPERLMTLWTNLPNWGHETASLPDYNDWKGHEARVTLAEPLNGRRQFAGVLAGTGEGTVNLSGKDGQDYAIPFASIHSAKLLLTDKLINATAPLSTEGADTIQTVED